MPLREPLRARSRHLLSETSRRFGAINESVSSRSPNAIASYGAMDKREVKPTRVVLEASC